MRIPFLFRSSILSLCLVVLVSVEGLKFTASDWKVTSRIPFSVQWTGSNTGSTQTLSLRNGTTAAPNLVGNITSNIFSNSYLWFPSYKAKIGSAYFLKIEDTSGASAYGDTFTVRALITNTLGPAITTISGESSTGASTTTTPTGASSGSVAKPSSGVENEPDTGASSGLSTGAKAVIGVGAAVSALAVIGAIGLLLLRRRRQKRSQAYNGMGEMQAHGNGGGGGGAEMEKKQVAEMPGTMLPRQEMDGVGLKLEMAG